MLGCWEVLITPFSDIPVVYNCVVFFRIFISHFRSWKLYQIWDERKLTNRLKPTKQNLIRIIIVSKLIIYPMNLAFGDPWPKYFLTLKSYPVTSTLWLCGKEKPWQPPCVDIRVGKGLPREGNYYIWKEIIGCYSWIPLLHLQIYSY